MIPLVLLVTEAEVNIKAKTYCILGKFEQVANQYTPNKAPLQSLYKCYVKRFIKIYFVHVL